MSTSSAFEKGVALEMAVRAIESAILRNFPFYNEKTFRIQSKKVCAVEGVHHEIDILVTVALGNGYDSLFIFECKNWQDAVNKNEIIVFSEKIRAIKAQRGFFVARSFTSDAVAQANTDSRLLLLRVADLPIENVPVPLHLHLVNVEQLTTQIEILVSEADGGIVYGAVDPASARLVVEGKQLPVKGYFDDWESAERDKRINSFPSDDAAEGSYDLAFHVERKYEQKMAYLDDKEIRCIRLEGQVRVRIVRPTITSFFEVETRGRALTVSLDTAEVKIRGVFVSLPDPAPAPAETDESPCGDPRSSASPLGS